MLSLTNRGIPASARPERSLAPNGTHAAKPAELLERHSLDGMVVYMKQLCKWMVKERLVTGSGLSSGATLETLKPYPSATAGKEGKS